MLFGKYVPSTEVPFFLSEDTFLEKYKLSISYVYSNQTDTPHYHDYFQIWYTVSGNYEHMINGEVFSCTPGSVALIMPYTVHALNTLSTDLENSLIISISFQSDSLLLQKLHLLPLTYNGSVFNNKKLSNFIMLDNYEKAISDELMTNTLFEYRKKGDIFITKVIENIYDFLNICVAHSSYTMSKNRLANARICSEQIHKAVQNIKNNYSAKLDIDSAAKKCMLSRKAFTNSFKRVAGKTYHEVVLGVRLMKAVELLRFTGKSISEIAKICSFSSSAHFINVCKSIFNATPNELRAEMRLVAISEESFHDEDYKEHGWTILLDSETVKEHEMFLLGNEPWKTKKRSK